MGKSSLKKVRVNVYNRSPEEGEEQNQTVELYGKAALSAVKVFGNSKYLSGNVADVMIDQKANPETGELVDGFIGAIRYTQDASGSEIADKDRKYAVRIEALTFKTTNQEQKEYEVTKPVKRDGKGNVTNLDDVSNSHGKTIGIKSVLQALNEAGECYLIVDKTVIQDHDTWYIKDASKLREPAAQQNADQAEKPRFNITVTANEKDPSKIMIAGPEIKDSEPMESYIKNDLGGKWNSQEKAWEANLPEGLTVGKMFYAVIDKARDLGVKPVEQSIGDMAAQAPEGGSVKDALHKLNTPEQKGQELKA
jgi:hypothetical protein